MLIVVSMFVTMTYFEGRFKVGNVVCKISGRDDLKFLIFKVTLVLIFVLLDVNDLRILVIIIITLLAVI